MAKTRKKAGPGRPKSADARSKKISCSFNLKTYQDLKKRVKLEKSDFRAVIRDLVRDALDRSVPTSAGFVVRKS